MSGIPPHVNAETGTPAGEWAAKTTSALDTSTRPTTMNPTTAQLLEEKNVRPAIVSQESTASTPGQEVPGAFPRHEELKPEHETLQSTVVQPAESVSNTTSSYLPAAAQTAAQYLPKSVVDTFSSYIPGVMKQDVVVASVHDHPHHISMPSSEVNGAGVNERSEGAGSLPGSVDEFDVTELPEQREVTMVEELIKPAPVEVRERVSGFDAPETSLPSQEVSGAKPFEHYGGVGALPGKVTEPAVATLPSENTRGATLATSPSVGTHGRTFDAPSLPSRDDAVLAGVSGEVGALPGTAPEAGVAVLPAERDGLGKWETGEGNAKADALRETSQAHPGVQPNTGLNEEKRTHDLKDPKIGESEVMADRARAAGAEKHDEMRGTDAGADVERREHAGAWDTGLGAKGTPSAKEGAVGGAAGAAAVGAAVGETEMQKQEQKQEKEEKKEQKKEQKESQKDEPQPQKESQEKPTKGKGIAQAEDVHAEQQANLRRVTLQPREHVLGSPGARWGGVDIGTAHYTRGENIDLTEEGYQTGYHPSEQHPLNESQSKDAKEHAEAEQAKEPAAEKPIQTGPAAEHEGQSPSQQQKTKKAGFMAKMKGEALTLLGKVEGKKGQEKVEEGQKLKTGQSAATH